MVEIYYYDCVCFSACLCEGVLRPAVCCKFVSFYHQEGRMSRYHIFFVGEREGLHRMEQTNEKQVEKEGKKEEGVK